MQRLRVGGRDGSHTDIVDAARHSKAPETIGIDSISGHTQRPDSRRSGSQIQCAARALDRFSDRVSDFASSTAFLLIHVVWFGGWIAANAVARNALDPYPFTFLTFLVSLEAIFLTSFVLISQNHLEAQAHRRAALDLQINLLAEREMTSVLRMVSAIAAHLGLRTSATTTS